MPRACQTNFFGTRLIACQITGKNGAEFKNHVENRFCVHAIVRVCMHKINFFGNRLIVYQITGKISAEFKNNVEI